MFDILVQEIAPCDQGASCRNSVLTVGMLVGKCSSCRLAPDNEDLDNHYWSGIRGAKHPVLEQEEREARATKIRDRQLKRLNKDRSRTKLLKKAVRAESRTEKNIIKSTVNSGRSSKDGDHLMADGITLDTKLQTNRQHPRVDLGELDKVGEDAKRAGALFGALVIRTANDVGVVVMKEEDFAVLVSQWRDNA